MNSKHSNIISGSCGDGTSDQNIIIQWTDKKVSNTMDLLFKFYPETHLYSMNSIIFNINASIFPNGSAQMAKYLYVGDDFWAPSGWSIMNSSTDSKFRFIGDKIDII